MTLSDQEIAELEALAKSLASNDGEWQASVVRTTDLRLAIRAIEDRIRLEREVRRLRIACRAAEEDANDGEGPWHAGAIGRIPEDDALVYRSDAVFGAQFYARSATEAESAAHVLNLLERENELLRSTREADKAELERRYNENAELRAKLAVPLPEDIEVAARALRYFAGHESQTVAADMLESMARRVQELEDTIDLRQAHEGHERSYGRNSGANDVIREIGARRGHDWDGVLTRRHNGE